MRKGLAVLLLLVSFIGTAFAGKDSLPDIPRDNKYVADFTGTLSQNEIYGLSTIIKAFNDSTSNEIAVVIEDHFDSRNYGDIFEYSFALAEKWGIGKAKKDNGVLIYIAKEDHKIWIQVGYGLEGALPDGLVSRIISNEITPAFKKGEFRIGIQQGLVAIMKATRGEYKSEEESREAKEKNFLAVIMILVIGVTIFVAISNRKGGGGRGNHRGGGNGMLTGYILGSMLNGGRGHGGGGFGGGGFGGGFGGGGFGGGGAGGSW